MKDHDEKSKEGFKPDCYIIQFKKDRKDYFIDRQHLSLKPEEYVLVQAERGRDMGMVIRKICENYLNYKTERRYPLEILKRADEQDMSRLENLRIDEEKAIQSCQEFVDYHGLDMKLVDAEYQFDSNKLTFYYTADQRVDFRELVKDLAATFRTRIELRQIGVRDEAKKLGGLAPCGRELCCTLWLDEFQPVTSQFARDQQLAVNPSKISGLCGRLMCCLTYEEDHYNQLHEKFPTEGDILETEMGKAEVARVDIIKDKIWLRIGDDDPIQLNLKKLKMSLKNRKEFLEKWRPVILDDKKSES